MEWYKLSPKEANLLLIIMNRLELPIEITVGKFAVFSLEYFSSVCIIVAYAGSVLSILYARARANDTHFTHSRHECRLLIIAIVRDVHPVDIDSCGTCPLNFKIL